MERTFHNEFGFDTTEDDGWDDQPRSQKCSKRLMEWLDEDPRMAKRARHTTQGENEPESLDEILRGSP